LLLDARRPDEQPVAVLHQESVAHVLHQARCCPRIVARQILDVVHMDEHAPLSAASEIRDSSRELLVQRHLLDLGRDANALLLRTERREGDTARDAVLTVDDTADTLPECVLFAEPRGALRLCGCARDRADASRRRRHLRRSHLIEHLEAGRHETPRRHTRRQSDRLGVCQHLVLGQRNL
jgi:hypothetical protein